jgi:hypothetical protein
LGEAGDAGDFATGVVEEDLVAGAHGVAEEIAGLVVADAVPGGGGVGAGLEVGEAEDVGLGFHEPVVHGGKGVVKGKK